MHLFYSLSCNLFGIYRQEHLQYILDKQEGRLYYTNKDQIDPSRQVLYSVVANPVSIYLKIAHIYQRPYNFSKKKPDGKIQTFVGKCTVVHKPLQANYWHFEVEVVDENNEKIFAERQDVEAGRRFTLFESYLKVHLNCTEIEGHVPEALYIETE